MLKLTRRVHEVISVYEGDRKIMDIIVTAIRGQQVTLGLPADKTISFVRAELTQNARGPVDEPANR